MRGLGWQRHPQRRSGLPAIHRRRTTATTSWTPGTQDDTLLGGPGDEIWIKGDAGDDHLDGGPGVDRLYPGAGADVVFGGDGTDEVTYQDNADTAPVSVSLDDVANDGVPGAGANVHSDVEDIMGGDGNDFLVGDADNNRIRGDRPDFGQNGNDTLDGGRGNDVLEGGDGNDTIRARDGFADTVDCGVGTDAATVDTIDTVASCETVEASAELEPDRDADGFDAPADCDDHDPLIKPGVLDVPENGIDEDCNGADARILDRDGDGFNVPQDCDDASRAISPGADEIRGNAVDEDCSGRADPFAAPQAEIASRWRMTERGAKALRLIVRGAPAGAVVELRCRGEGCPKPRTVRITVKAGGKDVKLHKRLRGHRLKPGARVEVRVLVDGTIAPVARFAIRRGKVPKRTSLCLTPGAAKPGRC